MMMLPPLHSSLLWPSVVEQLAATGLTREATRAETRRAGEQIHPPAKSGAKQNMMIVVLVGRLEIDCCRRFVRSAGRPVGVSGAC